MFVTVVLKAPMDDSGYTLVRVHEDAVCVDTSNADFLYVYGADDEPLAGYAKSDILYWETAKGKAE